MLHRLSKTFPGSGLLERRFQIFKATNKAAVDKYLWNLTPPRGGANRLHRDLLADVQRLVVEVVLFEQCFGFCAAVAALQCEQQNAV